MSDFFGIGSLLGSAVNSITQGVIADKNLDFQKDALAWQKSVDERNFNYQKSIDQRNFDYMAQTQQTEWNRADTAHQRQVDDLMKAGLSPLHAVGGSSSGSIVSQNSTPGMSQVNPVVPQIDGTGISNALSTFANTSSNMSAEKIRERTSTAQRISDEKKASDALDAQIEMHNLDIVQQKNNLDEIMRSNKASEANAFQANLLREKEGIRNAVQVITGSQSYYLFKSSDPKNYDEECLQAQRKWILDYEKASVQEIKKLGLQSKNTSLKAGVKVFGTGGDLGGSTGEMNDLSRQFDKWNQNYCAKNPYPWNKNL